MRGKCASLISSLSALSDWWASHRSAPPRHEGREVSAARQTDLVLEEESEGGEEALGVRPPRHGVWIAVATFVPTFLATVLGVPYLLGGARVTHTASDSGPPPAAIAPLPYGSAPLLTRSLTRAVPGGAGERGRDPFAAVPPLAARPLAVEPERETRTEAPAPRAESTAPAPSLPAAEPRTPTSRATPNARRSTELRASEQRKNVARDWMPVAAFVDREAARRQGDRIEQQGYPVEIREDRSSRRPWVVWIGAHPTSGEHRP